MTEESAVPSAEHQEVLQLIYEGFRQRGNWITFSDVDRPLRRRGIKSDAVVESLSGDLLLPFQNGRHTPIARDELQLSLRGISACGGGQQDIDLFLRLIPWLVERELDFEPGENNADEMQVKATEISDFLRLPEEPDGAISRLRHIIELQRWGWSGGEYANGNWYIQVARGISRFAGVETLDAYLDEMAKWEEEGKRPYLQIPDDFYGTVPGMNFDAEPQPVADGRVFIGHGRSTEWRELKDFIQDELGLQCDEFNRVEVAGTTTIDRMSQMLEEAAFAFLVLTAEDERLDGTVAARENVIHEAGLFQGRLGFERAIIMIESGCNEFSNIHGLTHLPFESGKIDTLFDRVRRTLKREGLI